MSRTYLLGAASAAALACYTSGAMAAAQPTINGGGSTLAQFDYIHEFATFNASAPPATFGTYWEAGSGAGQAAFLNDDLTCDINKVTGNNGGACSGGSNVGHPPVDYGASDSTLSATQIFQWQNETVGQTAAGNLIQLPSMGVGISIPVNEPGYTTNGAVTLTDHDLCEVFSGNYSDFSQITDVAGQTLPSGQFKVVYRTDGSGTSFLLTFHLAAACATADTAPGFTFTATTTFATLFNANNGGGSNDGNGNITSGMANPAGQKGSGGIANYLSGLVSGAVPQAIAYLSPDFTTIAPNSDATLSNGQKSQLTVAAVVNSSIGRPELPTTANITTGLAHGIAAFSVNLNPPTNATDGANPAKWIPLLGKVSQGYPIVGYTTFDFAQCYGNKKTATGIRKFLNLHLTKNNDYAAVQARNGFVQVVNSAASKFATTIKQHITANSTNDNGPWNTDIQDATACAGKGGR